MAGRPGVDKCLVEGRELGILASFEKIRMLMADTGISLRISRCGAHVDHSAKLCFA